MIAGEKLRLLGLAIVLLTNTVMAHGEEGGITVIGIGTAKAKPTVVEIGATVSGEAELTADAIVKYRDAKRRAIEKLEGLKIPSLTIEASGFKMNASMDQNAQMRMMQGMGGAENIKQKVQVAEQLKLVIKEIDKLETEKMMQTVMKVIDTTKDAGLAIGPPLPTNYYQMQIQMQSQSSSSMIVSKLPNASELRAKAYKNAVEDARQKASKLAELSGLKLGKVLAITEGGGQPTNAGDRMVQMMMFGSNDGGENSDEFEVSASSVSDITLTVRLSIQFEIQK